MKTLLSRGVGFGVSSLLMVILAGCGGDIGEEERSGRTPVRRTYLAFQTVTVDSLTEGCAAEPPGECGEARFSFVTFPDAPADLRSRLHEQVADLMEFQRPDENEELTLEGLDLSTPGLASRAGALAHDFIQSFREFRAEFPESGQMTWFVRRGVSVVAASPRFVTLGKDEYWYSGGAHPNGEVEYRTIHAETGERLLLGDLLSQGFEEPLRAAAEVSFREVRGLSPEQDLVEAGFSFWPGPGFTLNENFAPTDEGLRFHFDAYEIAPYSMGPTDFVVPWDAIRDLIAPGGPLGGFVELEP